MKVFYIKILIKVLMIDILFKMNYFNIMLFFSSITSLVVE